MNLPMDFQEFETNIRQMVPHLLSMAREDCWNTISDNCVFILSEEGEAKGENVFLERANRKKLNDKKQPKSIEDVLLILKEFYGNLYDVNLYVYKSEKTRTIIEIRYFLKTSHEPKFMETIIDNPPMLYCKIGIPPYEVDKPKESRKFDVNWEHGGIRHKWNMFKLRQRNRKIFK